MKVLKHVYPMWRPHDTPVSCAACGAALGHTCRILTKLIQIQTFDSVYAERLTAAYSRY